MQANRGLVQHVTHALQVAAQLRRQTNALRLATAERGRAAVQRQVAQAHFFQKLQSALDLGHQVARDIAFARGHAAHHLQLLHPLAYIGHAQTCNVGDADACKLHVARGRVQARAIAGGTRCVMQVFNVSLCKGLLPAFVVIVLHRIIKHLALLLGQRHTGAHAVRAPAVFAVVGKQPRVQLGIRSRAHRAGALGRKHLQLANAGCRLTRSHSLAQTTDITQNIHHTFAMGQRIGQRLAQGGLVGRCDIQTGHRELDVVFLEAVNARETGGGQKVAVHPKMRVATRAGPIGQLCVHALTALHQRRQQANVLAAVVPEQLRRNAVRRLRLHRRAVLVAMLGAQLHVQQTQKVPDLGGCPHRRLATAARQALLNGHGRRNAVHRIHLGPPCRLHDGSRVGIERFKITPLAFVEKNVKRQRRLA